MREIEQKIFPICAFGRAENLFYHSKGALLKADLSREQIHELLGSETKPLFPSHLLDHPDWEQLLRDFQDREPRLLVALGREWEELSSRILEAQRHGWALDVLVDRPLEHLQVPEEILLSTNQRWVVSPLRYYNPVHILQSLKSVSQNKEVVICFLEPAKAHSLLPNMEELMIARLRLSEQRDIESEIELMVLHFPHQAAPSFYQNPTLDQYQENFKTMEKKESLRSVVGTFFRAFPTLSSILAFLLGARLIQAIRTLREASKQRGQSLIHFYVELFRKGFWVTYDGCHRVFWGIYYGIPRFLRFLKILLEKSLWRIRHLAHMTGIFLRYLPGRLIALWVRVYWTLYQLSWRVRPWASQGYFILTWPARKFYWFFDYQMQTRLRPLFQKERRK